MAELEATMSVRELTEWGAYFNITPFGPWADDVRTGRICATVANFSPAVDWKKRKKSFAPTEFIPNYERKKPQTTAQQINKAKMITEALGGSIRGGRSQSSK